MSDQRSERSFFERLGHHIVSLSQSIGLAPEFLYDLVDEEDDWSFVVKLHALLELTVNELILVKLAEPGLAKMLTDRLNVAFESTY